MSADNPSPPRSLSKGRIVAARTLTVIGLLLALVSLLAVFVKYELLDDETFEDTSTLLLQSPEIQSQIAGSAVDALYDNVDVAAEIRAQLPADQQGLANALSAVFRGLANRGATELIARPRVQSGLVAALGLSHDRLVRLLEDEGKFTETEGGVVYLDLRNLVVAIGDRLGLPGTTLAQKLPPTAARIKLIEAGQVETAQRLTRVLQLVAAWLWVFVLLAWALAIWLVPGRRRKEVRAIAAGLVVVGVLVLLIRRVAGTWVVEALAPESALLAGQDAYDIITRHLRDVGWTDIMVGVVALAGVWLVGPGQRAQNAVRWLAPHLRRPEVVYGAFVAAWLLLLVWRPTVQFARPLNILIMVVLSAIGVEVLRRIALARHPTEVPRPVVAPPPSSPSTP